MFTYKLNTKLRHSDLKEPLSKFYIPNDSYKDISVDTNIDIQHLGIEIAEQDDIYFYTNDLRVALDRDNEGLFSYLYGENEILGCIFYDRIGKYIAFRIDVFDSDGDCTECLDDMILSSEDVEYLYDLLDTFAHEKGIELPFPRMSRFERIKHDTYSSLYEALAPNDRKSYRACFDTIHEIYQKCEDDICEYVIERMDPSKAELVPFELVAEAFWTIALQHIS